MSSYQISRPQTQPGNTRRIFLHFLQQESNIQSFQTYHSFSWVVTHSTLGFQGPKIFKEQPNDHSSLRASTDVLRDNYAPVFLASRHVLYVPVNPKPPIPPPSPRGKTPGHLTLWKILVTLPAMLPRSNAPPVRASKRVKSVASSVTISTSTSEFSQVFLFLMRIKSNEYRRCMSSIIILYAFSWASDLLLKIGASFSIFFYPAINSLYNYKLFKLSSNWKATVSQSTRTEKRWLFSGIHLLIKKNSSNE